MKVLYVIASMNPLTGGTCEAVRTSVAALNTLSIHAEVVSLDEPVALFLKQDSMSIHALEEGKGPWCYSAKLLPWLRENLARFDVVVMNGLWLYPSYAVWKAMAGLKKKTTTGNTVPKIFIMPHGMLDPWFQEVNGRKWKALRNWIYWKLIEKKVINDADGLLFTCETELLLARNTFTPYRPKREINAGYGIKEPRSFSELMQQSFWAKCPEVRNQSYLLFLSRIHPKKGVDLLIQAYADVIPLGPEERVDMPKLVIAGPGLDTLYGKSILHLLDKNPQLKDMVFFPGMLTGDAKWGALYGCDAFILPSHQENFGIAVAEALACSKPVLISNQVNIWREIDAAGGGLIAANTPAGVKSLLKKWLGLTIDQKQVMGQRARIAFENNFHIKQVASRLLTAIT